METINPVADTPVSIRNFLRVPPIFSFQVKNISVVPSIRIEPIIMKKQAPIYWLNEGIMISPIIAARVPTNAQNVISKRKLGLFFLFCFIISNLNLY